MWGLIGLVCCHTFLISRGSQVMCSGDCALEDKH